MDKKKKILVIAILAFSLTVVGFAATKPANALVFTSFESMVERMFDTIDNTTENMFDTMVEISDDIGEMADRILVMADNIGIMADRILIMADNIGIMADRIVATEELMADLVRDVTESHGPSALITYPEEGQLVSLSVPFSITLSTGVDDYALFISNNADMSSATNVLVQDGDTTDAISRAARFSTGDQLYLAVKAISNDTMGPISNTVMINISE